jgi:hypothetical protein
MSEPSADTAPTNEQEKEQRFARLLTIAGDARTHFDQALLHANSATEFK